MPEPMPAALLDAEWLEADGLGGFASGTVGGARTRRYHALLLAATTPPTGRMVLVNGLEVWLETPAGRFALSSQRYAPDVVHPDGERRLVDFRAEPWPQWTFRCEDGTEVSQEVIACHGRGEVVVRWRLLSLPGDVRLIVRPLLSGRDYHGLHHENPGFDFAAEVTGARVLWRPYPGVPAISAVGDGSYRHEPALVPQLPLPGGARARPRRRSRISPRPACFTWTLERPRRDACVLAAGEASPELDAGLADRARGAGAARASPRPLQRAADAYVVQRGQRQDDRRRLPLVHRLGPRHAHRAARLHDAPGRARARARHPARLGRRGLRGHAAQPLPGLRRAARVQRGRRLALVRRRGARVPQGRGRDGPRPRPRRRCAPPPAADRRRLSRRHALRHPHGRGRPARGRRAGRAADLDGRQDRRLGGHAPDRQAGRDPGAVAERAQDRAASPRRPGAISTAARWPRSSCASGTSSAAACSTWSTSDHVPGRNDGSLRPNQILAVGGLPFQVLVEPYATRVVEAVERKLLTPLGLRSLAPGEPGYRPRYRRRRPRARLGLSPGHGLALADGAVRRGLAARAGQRARGEARGRRAVPGAAARASRTSPGSATSPRSPTPSRRTAPGGCPFQAWSLGEFLRASRLVEDEARDSGRRRAARCAPPERPQIHARRGGRSMMLKDQPAVAKIERRSRVPAVGRARRARAPRRGRRGRRSAGSSGDRISASASGARCARTTALTATPGSTSPHDQARSRAYRWGEDGIAGISDDQQRLCLALALVERQGPDPEGAPVRPDQRRGQSQRGRQGALLLPRRHADPLLPQVSLQVSAGASSPTPGWSRRTAGAARTSPSSS